MATPTPQTAIADRVTVREPLPGQPAQRATLRADITKEYAVGGHRNQFLAYAQELSRAPDDLRQDFGADFYERAMAHDPVVSSCVNMLVDAVWESGITLLPAVGKDSPQYDKAVKVRDRCQRAIEGMSKPLVQSLRSMTYSYLVGGYKIGEVVCRQQQKPKQYALTLDRVKPKHRESVSVVVDVYWNVIGFRALEVGHWQTLGYGQYLLPEQVKQLLPRDKCALLTFRERDGDPRGTSILRPAYTPWWNKQQAIKEHLRYMAIVGTPTAIGTSAENEQDAYLVGPNGDRLKNTDGDYIMVSPQSSMAKTLQDLQSGTYAALPFGAKIELLQALTGGEAVFHNAFDYCDAQIIRSILFQTLATTEGQHNARAASDNHADIGGLLFKEVKEDLERVVRFDILRPLVRNNEGDYVAEDFTPLVSLSKTEQHDLPEEANAYAVLAKAGLLFPSQYEKVFADLGLPNASEAELSAATAQALAPPITPDTTAGTDDKQDNSDGA